MNDPQAPYLPSAVRSAPPVRCAVLDSDAAAAAGLAEALEEAGIEAEVERDLDALHRTHASAPFDVAILEEAFAKPKETRERLLGEPAAPAVIVVAPFGTVEGAVRALRSGAAHYCAKPVSSDELIHAVRKAAEARRLRQENLELRGELAGRRTFGGLTFRDQKMRDILALLETVAQTRATVLLLGESGTGKSVLARAIHQASPRREAPFVEVNCGALPDSLLESELFGHAKGAFTGALRDRAGRFEAAHGGTLFLDEIGNASPSFQLRLLRVLQDRVVERVGESRARAVDVRVLLATNRDLESAVRSGAFRQDLYYRIHVVAVEIPPLRERRLDIPDLAQRFLESSSRALNKPVASISPDALRILCTRSWPGNVRELENAIERAVAVGRGPRLEAADLAPEVLAGVAQETPSVPAVSSALDSIPLGPLDAMLAHCERAFLERALAAANYNRTKAASILGLHRATLYERMRRVGLAPKPPRGAPGDGEKRREP